MDWQFVHVEGGGEGIKAKKRSGVGCCCGLFFSLHFVMGVRYLIKIEAT